MSLTNQIHRLKELFIHLLIVQHFKFIHLLIVTYSFTHSSKNKIFVNPNKIRSYERLENF